MGDMIDASNVNGNNGEEINESSQDDERNSATERAEPIIHRTTNSTVHNTRRAARTYNGRFSIQLGDAQTCPSDDILDQHRIERGAYYVDQPSDSLWIVFGTYTFSTTLTETLFPWESEAVEDTEPHTMPQIVIVHQDIVLARTTINEVNHHDTGDTTQNRSNEMITLPPMTTESLIPSTEGNNCETAPPVEISRINEIELSTNTNEGQNDDESNGSSDDELIIPDSFQYTDSDDDQVDALAESGTLPSVAQNADAPDQANITNAETAVTSTLSTQMESAKRNVDISGEDSLQRALSFVNPPMITIVKVPTPDNSSDESGEEVAGN